MGCQVGQPLDNRVAYLPVAAQETSHPPLEMGTDKKVWTIRFVAFLLHESASNTHSGTLLDNFTVQSSGSFGWTRTYFGPITIKHTD